jgi:anti-anti-sigma factor
LVVTVRGEIDIGTTAQFREAVQQALARRPSSLCLDLSLVTFIDSIAIAILVRAFHDAQASGIRLYIGDVSPTVHRALHLTGLLDSFGLPPYAGQPTS